MSELTPKGYVLLLLLSHFSRVRLCATPQTAAHQASRPWDSPGRTLEWVAISFSYICLNMQLASIINITFSPDFS